jgi:hypothetical protein
MTGKPLGAATEAEADAGWCEAAAKSLSD